MCNLLWLENDNQSTSCHARLRLSHQSHSCRHERLLPSRATVAITSDCCHHERFLPSRATLVISSTARDLGFCMGYRRCCSGQEPRSLALLGTTIRRLAMTMQDSCDGDQHTCENL